MEEKLDGRFIPLIFDSIPMGIFTVDQDSRITSFNRQAEKITGYSRSQALGKRCYEIFRADLCQSDCPLRRSVKTHRDFSNKEVTILNMDGREIPIEIATAALQDEHGKVIGGIEMFRDSSREMHLRKKLVKSYEFEDIISKNSKMLRIFERLPLFANSSSTVLIQGASGTGKELVARALHNLGPRKDKPFIAVNCGALPDTLLESELFGYVKGAFTDAKSDKPGRFSLADGGTLFLDEIGDISTAIQVKLLRVLQEKSFEALGGTDSIKVDVRVIAATNRVLEQEVEQRRFREDLYYRLNVIQVQLPLLDERRDDIPLLVDHFREAFNALQGKHIQKVSDGAMAALMVANWPGNIRELENAIEHAFVVCQGDTIRKSDLPSRFSTDGEQGDLLPANSENPLEAAEALAISEVLERCGGNRTQAAKELGISRNTLWRKMKRLDLKP